jgi:hypothetical protein
LEHSLGVLAAVLECPAPLDEPALEAVCSKEACNDGSGFLGPDLLAAARGSHYSLQLLDPDLHAEEVGINPPWGWSSRRLPHPLQAASWEPLLGECKSVLVSGRRNWKLEADNYLTNIVKEGYRIPVYPGTHILPYCERNNCSAAQTEEEFVTLEVN